MSKKNCMFQYATAHKYTSTDIYHDTGLITLDEAKKLWHDNLPQFIRELQEGERPEMVIWTNCKNESDYGNELAHIDDACETDGVDVWQITKTKVEV